MKSKGFKAALSVFMLAVALPFSVLHAFAAEQNENILPYETYEGIAEDKCNVIAAQMYAAPGETVSYPVYLYHNTGYNWIGVYVDFDERLLPVCNQDGKVDVSEGSASDALKPVFSSNLKDGRHRYGMAVIPENEDAPNETDDGVLCYAKFKIPKDAQAGDRYSMKLGITELPYNTIDGWIEVRGESVSALKDDFKQHPVASAGVFALIVGIGIVSAVCIGARKKSK